jgi:hypothetical protein
MTTKTKTPAKTTPKKAARATQVVQAKTSPKAAAPAAPKTNKRAPLAPLAKAVAKSWTDKATAKARTTRHAVRVGKEVYPSVRAAFVALKLPLGIHQRVRLVVKRDGKATVGDVILVLVKE